MNDLLETFAPPIRDIDQHGQLTSSGFEWSEWLWHKPIVLLIFGIVCSIAALGAIAARNWAALGFLYFAVAALGGAAYIHLWRRIIKFERDGSVLTPHGLPRRIGKRSLPIKHADITSIEALPDAEGAVVAIYTEGGRTFFVSRMESFNDARHAAVQLTKALYEMRSSLTVINAPRHRYAHAAERVQIY